MKKKRHHYVYRTYLKPWTENGKIWCLRNDKIFNTDLTNVAAESSFYRVEGLTPQEQQLVERLLVEQSPKAVQDVHKRFLFLYSLPSTMKKSVAGRADPRFAASVDELISNLGEDFHQSIENSLLVYLRSMLAGNIDFYSDDKQAAEFLAALCTQFTRTKRAREAAVSQIGPTVAGCDVRKVMVVLSYLIPINVGASLYGDRKNLRLLVVENNTGTPFIAADQPVINLDKTLDGKPPEKMEFFYPLSPQKAMFLVESSGKWADPAITPISVNSFNILMAQNSHEQVFSNSKEYLDSIKDVVRQLRSH